MFRFVRCSELCFDSFCVQSHHRIFVRRSEPPLISISVQSYPRRIFSFDVQSHHSSVSVFRAISSFIPTFGAMLCFVWRSRLLSTSFRRSKPLRHFFRRSEPCFASFGVQSHVSLHSAFRAMFRFIRCSEPSPSSCLGFQSRYCHLV